MTLDTTPCPSPLPATWSVADRTAFEIGWDHARHRLLPPADHLHAGNPVRQGWEAGQAVFGTRTRQGANTRIFNSFGNRFNGQKVALTGNGKTCLNNIDLHAL